MQQIKEIIDRYKNKKVVKASLWYIAGQFLEKTFLFFIIPILTRLLPTTDEYGIISIYNTWSVIFGIIITLDLWTSINRAKFDYNDQQYKEYYSSTIFWGTIFSAFFIILLMIPSSNLHLKLFGLPKIITIYALFAGYFTFTKSSILANWVVQYKYKRYFFTDSFLTLTNVLLSIGLVLLMTQQKYLGRVYGGLIVNGLFALIVLFSAMRTGGKFLKKEYFIYALSFSAPLIMHGLAQIILAQSDRIMIDKFIGKQAVGIYSLANQIGTIPFVIATATNTAFVPWFFQKMNEQKHTTIRNRTLQYLFCITGLFILLSLTSPLLIRIFAPKRYWVGDVIIPLIISGRFFMFLYTLCYNIEAYYKKTHYVAIGTMLSALLNIILNYFFIPRYGYIAAAWTTLVSYIALFLFHFAIVKFIIKKAVINFITLITTGIIVSLISIIMVYLTRGT